MTELIDRLQRFYCYAYLCQAKSPNQERLWWKGYTEALKQILELLRKELRK